MPIFSSERRDILAVEARNRKHMEIEELQSFFRVAKDRSPNFFYPLFKIQYFFGLRSSEAAIIYKNDIYRDEKKILIKRLKKRFESDTGGAREFVYDIDDELLALIDTIQSKDDNPFLFPAFRNKEATSEKRIFEMRRAFAPASKKVRKINPDAQVIVSAVGRSTTDKVFKEYCEAAKIPENLRHQHTLRHTRATLMLASGATPDIVKHYLGHDSINTTYGYLGVANSIKNKHPILDVSI